jgi:predicted nucleic acid-binding Zn ribbon protein
MVDVRTCRICGAPIEPRSKTGRPSVYCSVGCRRASEYELRRLQARLIRLEDEAERCRRDRSGLAHMDGGTAAEHSADIEREILRAAQRLRELLASD